MLREGVCRSSNLFLVFPARASNSWIRSQYVISTSARSARSSSTGGVDQDSSDDERVVRADWSRPREVIAGEEEPARSTAPGSVLLVWQSYSRISWAAVVDHRRVAAGLQDLDDHRQGRGSVPRVRRARRGHRVDRAVGAFRLDRSIRRLCPASPRSAHTNPPGKEMRARPGDLAPPWCVSPCPGFDGLQLLHLGLVEQVHLASSRRPPARRMLARASRLGASTK